MHDVLAEDVSAEAVRLRIAGDQLVAGQRVFAIVRLSMADEGGGPGVAIRGRAARVDERPDGSRAVVVMATRRRWLFASGL